MGDTAYEADETAVLVHNLAFSKKERFVNTPAQLAFRHMVYEAFRTRRLWQA